jgi:hypothetical protein
LGSLRLQNFRHDGSVPEDIDFISLHMSVCIRDFTFSTVVEKEMSWCTGSRSSRVSASRSNDAHAFWLQYRYRPAWRHPKVYIGERVAHNVIEQVPFPIERTRADEKRNISHLAVSRRPMSIPNDPRVLPIRQSEVEETRGGGQQVNVLFGSEVWKERSCENYDRAVNFRWPLHINFQAHEHSRRHGRKEQQRSKCHWT